MAAGSATFPPPDRSGASTSRGPFSSFPAPCCRVNHPALAVGTPAAAAACSRVVNAGSCRAGPRPVTAARLAKKPHDAGAAGMARQRYQATHQRQDNAVATRPDAIASGAASDRLPLPEPDHPDHPRSSRHRPPSKPSRRRPPIHPRTCRHHPTRGSAPSRNSPKIPAACLATDPAATSSSSPRRVPRSEDSVRPRVARRYDASASGKPDSGSGAAAAAGLDVAPIADRPNPIRSCRHVLRMPSP